MSRAKFEAAKELIESQQYDEARALLKTIPHPLAAEWLDKVDRLDPPENERNVYDYLIGGMALLASLAIILGYFVLPWVALGAFGLTGWDVVRIGAPLTGQTLDGKPVPLQAYALYLVPLTAIIGLIIWAIMTFLYGRVGRDVLGHAWRFCIILVVISLIALVDMTSRSLANPPLPLGLIVTLIGAVLLAVAAAGNILVMR